MYYSIISILFMIYLLCYHCVFIEQIMIEEILENEKIKSIFNDFHTLVLMNYSRSNSQNSLYNQIF